MGKHPIRCGFMCPLRIALTLGQVAHATSGAKSGGEGVCGHSGQNGQSLVVSHPKTPILNCFYHLLWFYFSTVSEFSCLAKSFSVLA